MMLEMNENGEVVVVELDEEELEEVAGGRHVESKGNGVHIRTDAGTEYRIIGKVNKGDRLTYDGRTKTDSHGVRWYRVKWNGTHGYICSKYAKLL